MQRSIEIVIDGQVGRLFPGLGVTAAIVSLPQSLAPPSPQTLEWAGLDPALLAEHERIAPWRSAVRSMGLKAAEHRSSVEQLVRRYLKGSPPLTGISLVDAYNLASAKFMTPIGAYDLAKLETGRIELRSVRERDTFDPLGGGPADFPLRAGILVYAVEHRVACWALNVRDSQLTSVDTETRHALLMSESLDEPGAFASTQALDWLGDYITQNGGEVLARGTLAVSGFCTLTY